MAIVSILFIFLSFLSSFGDTLFLTGLPLYFYQESGGSILETTYVSVAITITVLLARKWIIRFNVKHPLLITAYGEFVMAAIEAVLLLVFFFFHSKWIVLAGVFPLALTYNFYAPAKFFKLQDYFFNDVFYLTAWQSAANRLGVLAAIFASGWVVVNWGLNGILIVDSLTFLFFGAMVLWGYHHFPEQVEIALPPDSSDRADANIIPKATLGFALVLIAVSTLFTSWEIASSIAVSSRITLTDVYNIAALRAFVSGLGVAVGLFMSRYAQKVIFPIWIFTLFALTLGLVLIGQFASLAIYVLFFFGGVLACIGLPIQRGIYERVKLQGGDATLVTSEQWIYNAALSLCLIPIGYFSDRNLIPSLNALQVSSGIILVVGLFGGFVIYKCLRGLPLTE